MYQEEIFGRGTLRAFWWSPDSSRLAFLQTRRARRCRVFAVVDHIPPAQDVEHDAYPKRGRSEPDREARRRRAPAGSAPCSGSTLSKYSGADHLIVDVGWTPDSKQVVYQVQNREQTWLDLEPRRR